MINLKTKEGVKEYLQAKRIFLDAGIEFVDIGNTNYIYKLKTGKSNYYLKHHGIKSRKTTEAIEKMGYKPDRFEREIGAIQFLRDTLDDYKDSIPEILHLDKKQRCLILTDVAKDGPTLKELLLTNFDINKVNEVLSKVAKFISQQHARTFLKENFEPYFKEDKKFNRRLYDFRTCISCEKLSKEQQEKVIKKANLLFQKNKHFSCLINADLSPKQICIQPNNDFGLCDFEVVENGSAVYDIGFFLSNIIIIQIVKDQEKFNQIIGNFLKIYFSNLEKELKNDDFIVYIKENLSFFIGTGILNRIDAVPLEPHIPESKTKELRNVAIDFIFNNKSVL